MTKNDNTLNNAIDLPTNKAEELENPSKDELAKLSEETEANVEEFGENELIPELTEIVENIYSELGPELGDYFLNTQAEIFDTVNRIHELEEANQPLEAVEIGIELVNKIKTDLAKIAPNDPRVEALIYQITELLNLPELMAALEKKDGSLAISLFKGGMIACPILGEAITCQEGVTGIDFITGEKLTIPWRVWKFIEAAGGIALWATGAGGAAKSTVKGTQTAYKMSKVTRAGKAAKGAAKAKAIEKATGGASELYSSAKAIRSGENAKELAESVNYIRDLVHSMRSGKELTNGQKALDSSFRSLVNIAEAHPQKVSALMEIGKKRKSAGRVVDYQKRIADVKAATNKKGKNSEQLGTLNKDMEKMAA